MNLWLYVIFQTIHATTITFQKMVTRIKKNKEKFSNILALRHELTLRSHH